MDYKEQLEEAKKLYVSANADQRYVLERLFSELVESNDERIRKNIKIALMSVEEELADFYSTHHTSQEEFIDWLEKQDEQNKIEALHIEYEKGKFDALKEQRKEWTAKDLLNRNEIMDILQEYNRGDLIKWFEKQCEQKSHNNVETKFHEGDWVVDNKSGITQQVLNFRGGIYTCTYNSFTIDCESNYHLWTIKDAKNGDVLQLGTVTAIFKKYIGQEKCMCYCSIDNDGVFEIPIEDGENNIYGCTNTTPATKEQRDLLFQKMKEAGYEWNTNKKELKNVDKKHIIEMKSPEESLGISSKEYNEIVNDCLYGELTPTEGVKKQSTKHQNKEELSNFEAALFSAFSDGWQQYLNGEEVDMEQWAKEHSVELLEVAKQNHAWTKEDDVMVRDILGWLPTKTKPEYNQKRVDWIKSIKSRVQQKQEFSEEDKERLKRIASFMWKNRKGDTDEIFQQEQDVKWLNSLIYKNS